MTDSGTCTVLCTRMVWFPGELNSELVYRAFAKGDVDVSRTSRDGASGCADQPRLFAEWIGGYEVANSSVLYCTE